MKCLDLSGFKNSYFTFNCTCSQGGAYATEANAFGRFENSNFYVNEASSGGALYVSEYANVKVLGSDFNMNSAISGGAMFSLGSSNVFDSSFDNNSAEDSVSSYHCVEWDWIQFVAVTNNKPSLTGRSLVYRNRIDYGIETK